MDEKTISVLEDMGWIVECELPLEIYNEESNSTATGLAAKIVINELLKDEHEKRNSKDIRCIHGGWPYVTGVIHDLSIDGYSVKTHYVYTEDDHFVIMEKD